MRQALRVLLLFHRKEMSKMTGGLKKVECDPKCGFMIRSHDEKEVIAVAIEHAKKSHNETLTEEQVRSSYLTDA
jgi:predicted small metal-binding protein